MNKTSKSPNGFTLIELLFATVILSVMLTLILTTFVGVFRFYVWAGTTRNNQSYTRDLLDTISREVKARKIVLASTNEICLGRTNPGGTQKTIKIFLQASKVQSQQYVGDDCASAVLGSPVVISNSALSVNQLDFSLVSGALNSQDFTRANPGSLRQSTTITIKVTNGTVAAGGVCAPTDPFCDQVQYTTAVNENSSSF